MKTTGICPELVQALQSSEQWEGDNVPLIAEDAGSNPAVGTNSRNVRATSKEVEERVAIALGGYPDSELWGDKGLIVATMRCVEAIGMIEDLVTTDHETKEAFIQRVRGILGRNDQHQATDGA